MSIILNYSSNNSGGGWWLSDEDWFALEDAGWTVHWKHPVGLDHGDYPSKGDEDNDPHAWPRYGGGPERLHDHSYGPEDVLFLPVERPDPDSERWVGALATTASKRFDTPQEGVDEWARVTKEDPSAEGCNCCGEPHSFSWTDEDGDRHYTHVEVTRTELVFE